jgi:DeoR family fructose operon transcriptional repressor
MLPSQRHDEILNLLNQMEKVRITDLQQRLQVTDMTIRRDLDYLEKRGLLERIRGGAAKIQLISTENFFSQKSTKMKSEKHAIGKRASELVEENDTIFMNSGSTVLQAAIELKGMTVKIITNNPMLTIADLGPKASLVLLGGEFRKESHSVVGDAAMNMLDQIYATKCFIGVDGLSMRYGLTNANYAEAGVNRKMVNQTRGKVIVVADHSKIGKVGTFLTCPIEKIDILITSKGLSREYYEQLTNKGIKVLISDE